MLIGSEHKLAENFIGTNNSKFQGKKKKAEVSPDLACRELTMEIFKGFHYNSPIILKR